MFYWSSIIFYALPLPILIFLIIISIFFSERKLKRNSILNSILFFGFWFSQSYKFSSKNVQTDGIEIVYWNAAHNYGVRDVIEENKSIPDIIVLVECDFESFKYIEAQYPDDYFHLSKEGIAVFSNSPLKIEEEITSEDNSTILKFETLGFSFYAVDVSPSILNFRKKSLNFIRSQVSKNEKTIVLGDFNTPFESVHFDFFKENFTNAFDEKGSGFRETWFWNVPLLMIDHIWVSKDLDVLKVDKINTLKSDHSMLRMFLNK
jgi:hypothetical protein